MNPDNTTTAATPGIPELEERIRRLSEEKQELAHEAEWWEIQCGRARIWRIYALWVTVMILIPTYPPLGLFAVFAAIWFCWDDARVVGQATARSTYPWVRRGDV